MPKRIIAWLMPNEKQFFHLLAQQSRHALDGATLLNRALANSTIKSKDIELMHKIEEAGDKVRHETVTKLNQSLITPIDREDIYELSGALDNILDATDRLMYRFKTYNKLRPSRETKEMAKILLESMEELDKAVNGLPKEGIELLNRCRRISELEEKADIYYRDMLEELFRKKDVKGIIVEKELIEFAEDAIDKCHHAAILIEGIVIKST